ncbi:type II toxin-antitoxin system VapB family antitoxin [Rhizobium puerariae]|uniref:Type II toxin-antitoxin system VapB family antitoxin n=1 Tax=Rhizobium puerariae TaxID=1585791 RepID=A0ABV6AKZ2_9HYPH
MRASLNLDDALLNKAKEITGLPIEATVEEALRRLVESHRQMNALHALEGIGGTAPITIDPRSRDWRPNSER